MQEETIFPVPIPSTSDDFPTLWRKPSLRNLSLFIESVLEEMYKLRRGGGVVSKVIFEKKKVMNIMPSSSQLVNYGYSELCIKNKVVGSESLDIYFVIV
jgi:hypothetical protein